MSPSTHKTEGWIVRFGRTFWLAWMVKGSAGVIPRLAKMLKTADFQQAGKALRESFGEATMRTAGTVAAFFALFSGLEKAFASFTGESAVNGGSFMAAGIASIVLQGEPETDRWSWAQYLVARAGVASLKAGTRPAYHRLLDYIMWAGSVGQLMYSFIVRPEVMEAGYEGYLKRVAMVDTETLALTRGVCLHGKRDVDLCKAIHGQQKCLTRIARVYIHVFKMSLPVYTALYIVPGFLFTQQYHLLHTSFPHPT